MFDIVLSREYVEFLRREVELRKLSRYEKLCGFSERVLPVPVGKDSSKKYQNAIDFTHMKVTPRSVISFATLSTILLALIGLAIIFILGFSLGLLLMIIITLLSNFFYWYNYPFYAVNEYRVKASSEMILSIIYMTVAMRVRPNLENAIFFTAENLSGPLALDLKELLWGVYIGKYESAIHALDEFTEKWRTENEEYTKSLNLIKNSSQETVADRERVLDEAVSFALEGTKERMKAYAQDLKTPLTVLNALGILLPLIGLIFFPIFMLFLPDLIRPVFIVVGYNILLPVSMYWMVSTILMKRPYTFHQPDVSKHPRFKGINLNRDMFIAIAVGIVIASIGFYRITASQDLFSFDLLISSVLVTWGVASSIIIYNMLSSGRLIKLREEFVQIEDELGTALFQIGYHLKGGAPLENSIKAAIPRIRRLKVSRLFELIVYNVETFGMTFEKALFDKDAGALKQYPSRLIAVIMKALVEISKSGMSVLSKAMISISAYLRDMRSVNEYLKEILEEITSTMKIQAVLLAPISAGVVVGLAAMTMNMLVAFSQLIDPLQEQLGGYGPIGSAGGGVFSSLLNLNQVVPIQYFQLIVGIYLIEIVVMLSVFLSSIEHGDENILRRRTIGKNLLMAMVIYTVGVILIYMMIVAVMPLTVLTG